MKEEGGEGKLRQKEQLGEGTKAGKHRTCMGNGEQFYLRGNDGSQMAASECKAKSVLHSVGNREPLKRLEQQSVMIRADNGLEGEPGEMEH